MADANNGQQPGWLDWAKWLTDAYGAYQATKGPKFKPVPQDPALTALRAKFLGYMDNSPTRNMLGSMLGSQLENAGQGFTMPQGYGGFKPYTSGPVHYDLKSMLPNIAGSSANPTGAPPTATTDPNKPPAGSAGAQTWNQWGYNGQGEPPWTLNDGASGPRNDTTEKRLPTVAAAPGGSPDDLLGSNGYQAWKGPGIDTTALKAWWDGLPDSVKMGGLGIVAALGAAAFGVSPAVMTAAMKGSQYIYNWYQQHYGNTPTPPTNPTNPTNTYNPSSPTTPVLP